MAFPATPPLRRTGKAAACTPAKRRRLRPASTVKRLWTRTRWSVLAAEAPPGPGAPDVQSVGCVTDISVKNVPDAELPDIFTQEQVNEIFDQLKETYKIRLERLECKMREAKEQHTTNLQDEVKKHILLEETYKQNHDRLQHELEEASAEVDHLQDKIEKYSPSAQSWRVDQGPGPPAEHRDPGLLEQRYLRFFSPAAKQGMLGWDMDCSHCFSLLAVASKGYWSIRRAPGETYQRRNCEELMRNHIDESAVFTDRFCWECGPCVVRGEKVYECSNGIGSTVHQNDEAWRSKAVEKVWPVNS